MDIKQIDAGITSIIEKKNKLATLTYDNKDYDKIEEELHDLEDDFIEKYGDYLEGILEDVHEKVCPDNDVLLPIAYLASKYFILGKNPDGTTIYDVNYKDGVWVDVDKYPGKDTRLVIVPNPMRILLLVDGVKKEIVWKAEN